VHSDIPYTTFLIRSLWYGVATTILSILIAYPMAYFIAFRVSVRWKSPLILLVLLSFFVSFVIRTDMWSFVLAQQGFVLTTLHKLHLVSSNFHILGTSNAVIGGDIYNNLPFMVLPIYSTLKSLDWRLIRAAEGLGARPLAVFRQILLPLSLPGISAGCILVFTLAIGFYITPALVGGPSDLMISMLIANQVNILDWPQAAAMAVVLLAVVLVIFAGFTRVMGIEKIFQGQR